MAIPRFLVLLFGVTFLVVAPLFTTLFFKWPIYTDFFSHATNISEFSFQFWSGDIYPRWLMRTNDGMGTPIFLFYPPLVYYAMSLFEWLSSVDPHGFVRLVIGLWIALFISGITSFYWLKLYMPVRQAQMGGFLYATFPITVFHVCHGFSITQMWALSFLPLLLICAHRVSTNNRKSLAYFALAYSLLTFTHPMCMLIFGGIPCLYVVCFSSPANRIKNFILATLHAALGVASAGIFLLPLIQNTPFIKPEFFTERFDYSLFLWDLPSLLSVVVITGIILGYYMELPKEQRLRDTHERFWAVILSGMLFIASPLATPLWNHIPLLQKLQGGWRIAQLIPPAAVFLLTKWLPHAKSKIMLPAVTLMTLAVTAGYTADVFFLDSSKPAANIMAHRLIPAPEYKTQWMANHELDFQIRLPAYYQNMPSVDILDGSGSGIISTPDERHIRLHADISSKHAKLLLRHLYFPGWISSDPSVTLYESKALLGLDLPKGKHVIDFSMPWYKGEQQGLLLSAIAFALILISHTYFTRHSPSSRHEGI